MKKELQKTPVILSSPEPPTGLLEKVIARIHREQRLLVIKRRLLIFSITTTASAIAFIPLLKMAKTDISESGFLQFLSLAFSDHEIVAVYWQNFAMSLLETLPVISFVLLLATVFIFLGSIKFWAKDLKIILSRNN